MTSVKVNFNTQHLKKGDPLPPYNGKLRLYSMRFCPYAQRAALTLKAKNVDFEVVNIDLLDKPEWLPTKSAFGKVPALEISEGVTIYESLVIAEYLDDVYPNRPLVSKDPVRKAFDKIIIEAASSVYGLLIKMLKAPESIGESDIAGFFKTLDFIQSELQKRGTKFLGGNQPGYVDYMIWPWFERLSISDDARIKPDAQKYKILLEYIANMLKDPIVADYAVPKELLQAIYIAYKEGKKMDYDSLIKKLKN